MSITDTALPRDVRDHVLTDPTAILEDDAVMRVLLDANDRKRGENVVDLRGLAMDRLETRLDRLTDTHRHVVAAAYDNLAGTNQIHRCVLAILDHPTLADLLDALAGPIADILGIHSVRLVLEAPEGEGAPHPSVTVLPPGGIAARLGGLHARDLRPVTLRRDGVDPVLHGPAGGAVGSEALLGLDLGADRRPGLLALGARDADLFAPGQATDLLAFLGASTERVLRRHLDA
ncbi:DUF484 family protein [Jannaschia sp. LMIT008]|uniref:DUF484 family protein n=1 Tax=Jannaschia maritima TaxID=3032585 RepID=UPI002811702F|nr:DUF484 family protein [Jannaschia sp. LMIT008]